jgi:hypothetical protein
MSRKPEPDDKKAVERFIDYLLCDDYRTQEEYHAEFEKLGPKDKITVNWILDKLHLPQW